MHCRVNLIHSPLQVCSAIHNQDFTLVDDYISGLKTLLYLQAVDELSSWDGQCPPTAKHQKGKPLTPQLKQVIGKALPEFGPFLKEKEEKIAAYKKGIDPLKEHQPEVHRPAYGTTKPIPHVKVSPFPYPMLS